MTRKKPYKIINSSNHYHRQHPRYHHHQQHHHNHTKWGPQTIAKLVNITPMSLWFMVPITIDTIVFMGFINHLTSLGGPHIVFSNHEFIVDFPIKNGDCSNNDFIVDFPIKMVDLSIVLLYVYQAG